MYEENIYSVSQRAANYICDYQKHSDKKYIFSMQGNFLECAKHELNNHERYSQIYEFREFEKKYGCEYEVKNYTLLTQMAKRLESIKGVFFKKNLLKQGLNLL